MQQFTFLFPGQGSQKIGMGKDFVENSPMAKELVEAASDRLHVDFQKLLFEENDLINQTQYTQPAILLVSTIAHALFRSSCDQKPKYTLGHSLGEFSALVASGALDPIDAVELVHMRGKFMQEAAKEADGGMMVVMGLEDAVVEAICEEARSQGKRVWPANYNSDGQIVVAGIKADLNAVAPLFKEKGAKRALLLNMSVASHCPLMEPAREPLREYLEKFIRNAFEVPVVANVDAKPYNTKTEAIRKLDEQLVKPVLYKQSIKSIENENDLFIELGEGCVLSGINRRVTKVPTLCIKDMKSLEETLQKLS
ncbi:MULTISPECIES: ACP S-malonyltransferase [unclassified Nitratiruptor]|uniref:ACP S-malonyltransferase n=1 Tax=unclassified Nitratiruptor TaxID=2624044 RepID=UPI001916B306|nr:MULTISPECIES: ACP S-malonyltransferase [unclassified Nitratiruptor]BCD60066.1 [acyl-carrier-protein] S-malonyltransferase [Nitratiruptor sp. YY08-10]BCD64445.1 [acyl-carrier-protein] S-malonyltransferase [Nitratiruptor sp. YY08-14]